MNAFRYCAIAVFSASAAALSAVSFAQGQSQQPQVLPTRDVDITYADTRPGLPATVQRRRWSASEHLQRVEGKDKTATIFDRNRKEFTLLNPSNKTFLTLEGSPRMPLAPGNGVALHRGSETVIAGQHCVDWSWTADDETRTACLTPDGVLLRLIVDGQTILLARSVHYAPQPPDLFQIPPGYEPALGPAGGPER